MQKPKSKSRSRRQRRRSRRPNRRKAVRPLLRQGNLHRKRGKSGKLSATVHDFLEKSCTVAESLRNLSHSLPRPIRSEARQKPCNYLFGFIGRTVFSSFPTAQAGLINPHEFCQLFLGQTERPSDRA